MKYGKKHAASLLELPIEDLVELKKEVAAMIAHREKDHRKSVIQEVEDLVRARGFDSVFELYGIDKPKAARKGSGEAKYRNPEAPEQTWSGLGRRPAWFKAALEDGLPEEALLAA